MNLLWTIFDYDGAKTADKYTAYGYIPTQPFWTRRHMMTLDDATTKVAEKLGGPPMIDPAFLLFLKELLMEFLPVLLEMCQETAESAPGACKAMQRGGGQPFRRWLGRRMVRRRTRGMPEYDVTPVQLLDAMLEVGAAANPSDIEAVYDQC